MNRKNSRNRPSGFRRFLPFFTLVFCVSSVALFALNAEMGPGNPPLTAVDQQFMIKAAQGGMAEMALGKLAEEKGGTKAVRKFGKMMVADHGKICSEMSTLAKKKGIDLPDFLDERHQAKLSEMSKLSGTAFDQAYLVSMASMHDKSMAAFTKARAATSDVGLQAVLDKAIPVIKSHIEELGEMAKASKK